MSTQLTVFHCLCPLPASRKGLRLPLRSALFGEGGRDWRPCYTSHILTKSTKLQVSPTWISLNHTQFVSVFLVCAHPSVRPSVRPPARPSTYLPTFPPVCLSVCLSVCMYVCRSVCLISEILFQMVAAEPPLVLA